VTARELFDVVEVGDGHWSIHTAGTTEVVGVLQEDADGFTLTDAHEKDLGTFPTLDDALARLSGDA
jgi:hypothetical protein